MRPDPKIAQPVKVEGLWRIRRSDGELVGYYASKALCQRAIDTQGWIE